MRETIKAIWNQIRYAAADVIDLVGLLICIPAKPLYDLGCFMMKTSSRIEDAIEAEYDVVDAEEITEE